MFGWPKRSALTAHHPQNCTNNFLPALNLLMDLLPLCPAFLCPVQPDALCNQHSRQLPSALNVPSDFSSCRLFSAAVRQGHLDLPHHERLFDDISFVPRPAINCPPTRPIQFRIPSGTFDSGMVTWFGVSAIRELNAAVGDARWFQATALVGPSQQPTHQSLATGQPVFLGCMTAALGGGRQRCSRLWLCVTARQRCSSLRRTIQAVFACQHPSNHLVLDDEARFTDVVLQIRPRSARQTNRSQTDQPRKAPHHHQAMMAMHTVATEPVREREMRQHQGPSSLAQDRLMSSPESADKRPRSHHQISSTLRFLSASKCTPCLRMGGINLLQSPPLSSITSRPLMAFGGTWRSETGVAWDPDLPAQ